MARLARLVVPGLPHLVTQRATRGTRVFRDDGDFELYRDLLAEHCRDAGVEVWAWCLMPNQVHLILVPSDTDGLRRALAATHRRYAGLVHAQRRRTGHFWQGRFGSAVMDEAHLAAALRQLAREPVRAKLVRRPQDWRWSSARALITNRSDGLTARRPVQKQFGPLRDFLAEPADPKALKRLSQALTIGRPVGSPAFLARLEKRFKRTLIPAKRGPKPRSKSRHREGRAK
jgi:putative transposase